MTAHFDSATQSVTPAERLGDLLDPAPVGPRAPVDPWATVPHAPALMVAGGKVRWAASAALAAVVLAASLLPRL